jgi:photoactive yellow protein
MPAAPQLRFDEADLLVKLDNLQTFEIDALQLGVIGFATDADARVVRYSAYESKCSGLSPESVIGLPLFSVVAQCMNNFLVAQRFEDALRDRTMLDVTLDFVLTLRMRPTPVKLRLLAAPDCPLRYVVIEWPR